MAAGSEVNSVNQSTLLLLFADSASSTCADGGEVEGTGLVQPEEEKAARGPSKCL